MEKTESAPTQHEPALRKRFVMLRLGVGLTQESLFGFLNQRIIHTNPRFVYWPEIIELLVSNKQSALFSR